MGNDKYKEIKGGVKLILQYLNGKPFGLLGASSAYDREVFSRFPKLSQDVDLEDFVLFLRAMLLDRVQLLAEPLIYYRSHEYSASCMTETGPERYRLWSIKHGPSLKGFIQDVIYSCESGYISAREKRKIVKAIYSWTKSIPVLEAWRNTGVLKRTFYLFPLILFRGNRRIIKFAKNNLFKSGFYG